MSNAQPQNGNVFEFRTGKKVEEAKDTLIRQAQAQGEKPCLTVFFANEKLYACYGSGYAVAGVLRGVGKSLSFRSVDFKELTSMYVHEKVRPTAEEAIRELVGRALHKEYEEDVRIIKAGEAVPEELNDEHQVGEDI